MSDYIQDYESCLLLTLLTNPDQIPLCDLSPDEFSSTNMAEIYRAIESLNNQGLQVDLIQAADYLRKTTDRDWFPMLAGIAKAIHTTSDVVGYAAIVRRANERRKAAYIGQTLAGDANLDGAIDTAIRDLMALSLPGARRQYDMKTTLKLSMTEIEAAHEGLRKGISTGLVDLDSKLGGLHNGDLVVIGARPAMGKTAFLLNMALAASAQGHSVGVFSGEQDIIQMGQRLLAIQGRVPIMRMRNGDMKEEDFPKLSAAVHALKDRNFITDDTPSPSLSHVVRSARSWKYGSGIGVLFIDYLQRMDTDKTQKRFDAVGDNVRGLKNLARELNIPVVVLAQVGRQVEKRDDKRPGMGDLSDSSEIEKEADQIFMLYRDEVYNEDTSEIGIAEILIDKNRHGPTGYIKAIWRGEVLRFENMARAAA